MRKTVWQVVLFSLLACGTWPCFARESIVETLGEQFAKQLAEQTKVISEAYPDLKGSVKLAITVEKPGWVSLVEAKETRIDDTAPLAGILEKVYAWKFSPLAIQDKNVTIQHIIGFDEQFDSTRLFFVIMGVIMVTITTLIILVRVG